MKQTVELSVLPHDLQKEDRVAVFGNRKVLATEPVPGSADTSYGHLKMVVVLDGLHGEPSPIVRFVDGGRELFIKREVPIPDEPIWEKADEVLVTDKDNDVWLPMDDGTGRWYMPRLSENTRSWFSLVNSYGPVKVYRQSFEF